MSNLLGIAKPEPLIRLLDPIAVDDALVEYAEIVAETVSDGGQIQHGHGV